MRILYLKLQNFKRFPLTDVEIFEHEFKSKLLLIVGPNGSGKSSLFNELTPLPSDKNNFIKDGYKEIHIEKDNDLFILISDFRDGTKYSFILNDEELNPSNKITFQRDLVYKYFKINTYIHELLIGIDNFTDMSLLNRKKLFNSITHLNIDAILKNYNTLKEDLKNNEYLLKNQMSLLQIEEQKLANKDHVTDLIQKKDRAKNFLDQLLALRTDLHKHKERTDIDSVYNVVSVLFDKLNNYVEQNYVLLTAYPEDYTYTYKYEIDLVDYKLKELYAKLETLETERKVLTLNKDKDEVTLQKEYDNLIGEKKKIESTLTFFKDYKNLNPNIEGYVYTLETSLPDIVSVIPLNESKQYSKNVYNTHLEDKSLNLSALNKILNEETKIKQELDHYITHQKSIECPKCNHTWIPEKIENKIAELKTTYKELLNKKADLQNNLPSIESKIKEQEEYFEYYKNYTTLRKSTYEPLKQFWNEVDSNEYIFKDPKKILYLLTELSRELHYITRLKELDNLIEKVKNSLDVVHKNKEISLSELIEHIEACTEYIEELQLEKQELTANMRNNIVANDVKDTVKKIEAKIQEALDNLQTTNLAYLVTDLINIIDNELSKHKVIIIEIEKELTNYNNVQYAIANHKKEILELESNIKVLKIILKELSPKNGLIAKSISSFLNVIITNVNGIIDSIWDYKMRLVPIDIEADTLNYKFKVIVEDKLVIDDINKVSSGMKEVINLSFKLVLYKLLKLESYPVYLDEFGIKLDKSHRSKISELIFKMINTSNYSQIFLITHLDMAYSVFKDVDVLELG